MENTDQLQQTYAAMTEDELADVASDSYDLTEIAQQVLRAEISRRGLKIELQNLPPRIVERDRELSVLATVHSREEARKILDLLSESGIDCFLGHENVKGIDAFQGSFDHGVDLKVDSDDTRIAGQLLASAQRSAEEPEEEDDEDEANRDELKFTVHCPKCHSDEIILDGREAPPGVETEVDEKYNWHCDACGYQWQDDGIEE